MSSSGHTSFIFISSWVYGKLMQCASRKNTTQTWSIYYFYILQTSQKLRENLFTNIYLREVETTP